ncbi:DEKNAAC103862 [Brettanomyces naardenensis]|uniref:Elongation factor 1 alpha-like protein n=1 Tax=Brettanomyces naardenensis TaxID=13370 RepID=A0A448YPC3_BRENA|nr:DEKNAAC103862 [Brettanomyces naardenensis]
MPIDYSQDEMLDYANGDQAFDEETLTNEEYDNLYRVLPKLKQHVTGKYQKLDEQKMKELLWNNYFNLDDTLAEIKTTFKPVKLSKLALLAKGRVNSTGSHEGGEGGGLSGLLARRRVGGTQKSGLAGLMAARKHGNDEAGLTKLEMRMKKRRGGREAVAKADIKVEGTKVKAAGLPILTISSTETLPVSSSIEASPSLPLPSVSSSLPAHLTFMPTTLLSKIIFPDRQAPSPSERSKLEADLGNSLFLTNDPNIARKIAKNFSQPSPDEKRKKVEEVTKELSKVKLTEKKRTQQATKPKHKIDLDRELAKKSLKPNLSFVVIGHVDSGKSTLIGRMLYDLHIVDSKTMHRLTKESESIGKSSFSLAWIMDQTPEERSRGVTVDICQTQFETERSRFTVIDSPGHKDYVPQMVNGVTQADLAVVLIDSVSFEAGFSNNGQTKEHLTIAKNLGIERCIVAVNKMDSIEWDQFKFDDIKGQLRDFLVENLGYKVENLLFVPTSGYLGDNVVKKSTKCHWYKGKSLLQLLEDENKEISHAFDKKSRFIMTINDLQQGGRSDEVLASGRITSGLVQPGETVVISPSQQTATVDSISVTSSSVGSSALKKDSQNLAIEGEFVEMKLKKLDNVDNIKIGDLATKAGDLLKPVKKFKCELTCFNLERPLLVGTPFILFRGNISIPSRLSKIDEIVSSDGKVNKRRKHLSSNNKGFVDVEILERAIPMLSFGESSKLGRIVIRKDGRTVGAGRIVERGGGGGGGGASIWR